MNRSGNTPAELIERLKILRNMLSEINRPAAETCDEAADQLTVLTAALTWYAEQAEGCRKLGSIGDPARHALNDDGGKRARAALTGEQR